MAIQEIPLTADNQQFSIVLGVLPGGLASYGAICTGLWTCRTTEGSR
ncbi:bacteriophage protein [Escherichia coli]|uniref:Bacteriophage protein n=1 Tax=Escherichia coli TaxID=562 RepID=A0A377A3P8_ECOLX|nr:bacteriophage protein [Escherichia coli]